MCPGAALRREYRRCVERDLARGRAGACGDVALAAALRGRLRRQPALLPALHGDAAALLAAGLRGRREPGPALRRLAAAFELLELAALNLYLFPWRREFRTVKTFSGTYVHGLRAALPEAELTRSFACLGYARRDEQHLVLAWPPPAPQLVAAACGFFACRLACELLAEAARRPRTPRLLRAPGGLDACSGGEPRRAGPARLARGLPARDSTHGPHREPPHCHGATEDLYRGLLRCNGATEDLYQEPPRCDGAAEDLYWELPRCEGAAQGLHQEAPCCNGAAKDVHREPSRCDAAHGVDPNQELPRGDATEDLYQEPLRCDVTAEDLYWELLPSDTAEGLYPEPPPRAARSGDPHRELLLGAARAELYRELLCHDAATEDVYWEPAHDADTEDRYQEPPHDDAAAEDLHPEPPRCNAAHSIDVAPYQEAPAGPEDAGPAAAGLPEAEAPVLPPGAPCSGARRLRTDPRGAQDVPRRGWDIEPGQELLPAEGAAAPDASARPDGCGAAAGAPLSPRCSLPTLPCYQLHSCLRRGALPAYCCSTCQQLHAGTCAALPACRSRHRGQELRGERQQRLWLQRSEVDRLLAPSTSARP